MSAERPPAAPPSALAERFATGMPRALILYSQSRGLLPSLAWVVAVCSLLWWLQGWGERGELRQALLVQTVPALIASVIGISVQSPFGEPERASARSMGWIRAAHLAVLLLPGLVIAALLVSAWRPLSPDADLVLVVVRNIAGLTGVALLCGRVVDARLTWAGPFLWTAFALIGSLFLRLDDGARYPLWQAPWWAWTARSEASGSSWAIALAGAVVMCRFGPRDVAAEEQ